MRVMALKPTLPNDRLGVLVSHTSAFLTIFKIL